MRTLLFLAFWLMISGWATRDLPVGITAAGLASWASLTLLPPQGSRLRLAGLAALALDFFRQSVVAGWDVARRALHPRRQLRPGFVACQLRLPPGDARSAFCAFASLLPGTLPTGTDDRGALLVHGLDTTQPIAADLAAQEALFIRTLGHE